MQWFFRSLIPIGALPWHLSHRQCLEQQGDSPLGSHIDATPFMGKSGPHRISSRQETA